MSDRKENDLDMRPVREKRVSHQRSMIEDNYNVIDVDLPKKAHRKSVNYELENNELERKSAFLQEMKYGIPPMKGNKKRQ